VCDDLGCHTDLPIFTTILVLKATGTLLRAEPALMPALVLARRPSVGKSADAAR
jgi:hypothetical protein